MQITIKFDLDEPLALPVNYNHIIQGIIYHALDEYPDFADAAHNNGFRYDQRKYKTFTFGNLKGHYRVRNKQITFDESLSLEIRSPFVPLINIVGNHFAVNGIRFGERHINDVEVTAGFNTLSDSVYHIRMASPICVYSTDPNTRWTRYYRPDEEKFYYQIESSFVRKYTAFKGEAPPGTIRVSPAHVNEKDKVITKYKGSIIEAWSGEYYLEGDPECLTFLYDSGLGSKNPEGFGMFDYIDR